ncbi:MAG: NlpC/P60 family protein [Sphingobacteriaceae bacterium]
MKLKSFLISVFLLSFWGQYCYASGADTVKVQEIINLVQKKYAPDKRVAYFKVRYASKEPLILNVESTEQAALIELRSLIKAGKIQATVKETLLPAKDLNGLDWGIANLSVSNNRFAPSHSAEMATQVLLGTPVQILKKEHRYFLIRTPDNYLSWTEDAGIAEMDKKSYLNWLEADKVVFTALYGQSYSTPSENSVPVSDLVAGNILKLIGTENDFYKVSYPDNRIAYVPVKNAANYKKWITRPNPNAGAILSTAKALVGIPYLWGGTSVKGLDCSGFTKTAYFLNGVILPRDASQQVLYGEPVDIYKADTVNIDACLQNLKPGDLLFFAARKNKVPNARITHTAIYMGDGQFIQAAGLVRINSFMPNAADYDGDYTKTLVSARRILTSIGKPGISRIDAHPFYSSPKNKYEQ